MAAAADPVLAEVEVLDTAAVPAKDKDKVDTVDRLNRFLDLNQDQHHLAAAEATAEDKVKISREEAATAEADPAKDKDKADTVDRLLLALNRVQHQAEVAAEVTADRAKEDKDKDREATAEEALAEVAEADTDHLARFQCPFKHLQ